MLLLLLLHACLTSLGWRGCSVNGAAMFARGANMIPMDEFEGRYDAGAHARLVQSATEANMNVLRVWGGGVFLPDVWYDTCDKLGVLVYHDMQFAQEVSHLRLCNACRRL